MKGLAIDDFYGIHIIVYTLKSSEKIKRKEEILLCYSLRKKRAKV